TGFHVVTTFSTRILVLFGSFIVSVLLARLLGPEGQGVVAAIFVVPNIIISIGDLGIRQASAYFIGRKLYSIKDVISSNMLLCVITSVISMSIVAVYYSTGYIQKYGVFIIILALIFIPIKLLTSYFGGVIQGTQKISNINLKELISLTIQLFSILLLVWYFNMGVKGAVLTTLIVASVGLFYYIIVVSKLSVIKIKYINPIPQELFKRGIAFALALFILTLNYKIDILFLEKMVTSAEVGIYSVGTSLAELIWQLPAAISLVLFARSANSKSDNE